MKREADIKEILISNAIHLIAEGGFEKATTKELTHYSGHLPDFKMNEVYIYRLFGSKEHLYESVFICLDQELFYALRTGAQAVKGMDVSWKERMHRFFIFAWEFLLRNEERCRCYVRYYYSVYFKGQAREKHNVLFQRIVTDFSPIFKEEADVEAILHSVLTTLMDFAIRVHNGDLEDNENNRLHIFNVLYSMMATYLKEPVAAS